MRIITKILFAFFLFFVTGCTTNEFTPKPKAYPKIDFPKRIAQNVEISDCPYRFMFPDYGSVKRDTLFFDENVKDECWLDIKLEDFNGTINLTYKEMSGPKDYEQLVTETYKMAYKHSIRADYIDESLIKTPHSKGLVFDLGGNSASQIQFFATDSSAHFLRGSLHFKEQPNPDSLSPIISFVRDDIIALLSSLEWQ